MSAFASVLDLLSVPAQPNACPGCGAHAPAWTRATVDGLRILTHDGDVICPEDRHFGAWTQAAPAPVRLGVAA